MDPRAIIRQLILDITDSVESWKCLENKSDFARKIERSCFNAAIIRSTNQGISRSYDNVAFKQIYSEYVYKITSHLDPTSIVNLEATTPTYFADLVASGSIDLNNIAYIDDQSMQPEANAKIRNYIEARKNVKDEKKVSHAFTCHKCKGNITTFFTYQKRSADEPETKSITCQNEKCGHMWEI